MLHTSTLCPWSIVQIHFDPTSQDDTTLLSAAHFDNGWSPIPLITACTKDIGIEDVPMTEKNTRKGQKLTNFLLDNPFNDSNKFTMVSDAHFDSVPMPTLPNAACGIKTNTKNASMDRNAFKNGQKMMDSTTDDNPTKSTNNTPFFQNLLTLTWMISPCLHPVTWRELTALRIPRNKSTSEHSVNIWKDRWMTRRLHQSSRASLTWT